MPSGGAAGMEEVDGAAAIIGEAGIGHISLSVPTRVLERIRFL